VKPSDVAIRVETDAGEVAQVDFGYVGYLFDPETRVMRKAWVFVMVLGYSRHQFARVVFDQRSETWLRLHAMAFAFFGGVPATIVPDNLKAAVVRCAYGLGNNPSLHRSYVELARFYRFKVDPAPPKDPEKKGKVEAGVKYVCTNFFGPRNAEEDITVVNTALLAWVNETAGRRVHGTTGRRPIEVFEAEEKAVLTALPPLGWVPTTWRQAKVHRDTHVAFERRYYSVPWPNIGKDAWIRATPDTVEVWIDDARVATHSRRGVGVWSSCVRQGLQIGFARRGPWDWGCEVEPPSETLASEAGERRGGGRPARAWVPPGGELVPRRAAEVRVVRTTDGAGDLGATPPPPAGVDVAPRRAAAC